MTFDTNLQLIDIFDKFEKNHFNILEEELTNRYRDIDKVTSLICYLNVNTIKDDDVEIQMELNYFLNFMRKLSQEEISVINSDIEIATLKLVKLKLTILYMIEKKLLENKQVSRPKKEKTFENLEKRYLDVKEVSYIYGITEKMQNQLREKNILQCTQLVENGKVLYDINYLEEFMKGYTHSL